MEFLHSFPRRCVAGIHLLHSLTLRLKVEKLFSQIWISMLEVFTFRPILEVKGVFRLLLLLYCCCIVIFSPRACAVLIRYYKHVLLALGTMYQVAI